MILMSTSAAATPPQWAVLVEPLLWLHYTPAVPPASPAPSWGSTLQSRRWSPAVACLPPTTPASPSPSSSQSATPYPPTIPMDGTHTACIAKELTARIECCHQAVLAKMQCITDAHTSEWYNLSSN